jgi:hypothetical protein
MAGLGVIQPRGSNGRLDLLGFGTPIFTAEHTAVGVFPYSRSCSFKSINLQVNMLWYVRTMPVDLPAILLPTAQTDIAGQQANSCEEDVCNRVLQSMPRHAGRVEQALQRAFAFL